VTVVAFGRRIAIGGVLAAAVAAPADAQSAAIASFLHTVTAENLTCASNQCTVLSHPVLSDVPGNLLSYTFFTPSWNPPGSPGVYYDDPLVRASFLTEGAVASVAIMGIDPMPIGASFNVLVVVSDLGTPAFPCLHRHVATGSNITGHYTELDAAGLNSNPGAILLVTRFASAGGTPRPFGVQYVGSRWRILNLDLAPMFDATVFAVLDMACASEHWRGFIHTATAGNIDDNTTRIDDPEIDGDHRAHLQVTQNVSAGGSPPVLNNHAIGVWYNDFVAPPHHWGIFNQDFANMPVGADFNAAEIKVLFASGFERGTTADFDVTVP
jgi:hypothetical protein